jgi:hypothetical protein
MVKADIFSGVSYSIKIWAMMMLLYLLQLTNLSGMVSLPKLLLGYSVLLMFSTLTVLVHLMIAISLA